MDRCTVDTFAQAVECLNVPWIESPFFYELLNRYVSDSNLREIAVSMHERGFAVIPDAVDPALIDRVLKDYPKRIFDRPGSTPDPNRRQDAWRSSPAVKQLALYPQILAYLQFLYRRKPVPFQTLNFQRGTEQSMHSDAMHFASVPERFMCGVWVALEDVGPHNGTLRYAVGSHRLPEVSLEQLAVWGETPASQLGESYAKFETYLEALLHFKKLPIDQLVAKKGTALIWASNLIHGGGKIEDPASTRRTQVTHYFFDNCLYYTPILSNRALGEFFARDVMDISTEKFVPHMLNGEVLRVQHRFKGHLSRFTRM